MLIMNATTRSDAVGLGRWRSAWACSDGNNNVSPDPEKYVVNKFDASNKLHVCWARVYKASVLEYDMNQSMKFRTSVGRWMQRAGGQRGYGGWRLKGRVSLFGRAELSGRGTQFRFRCLLWLFPSPPTPHSRFARIRTFPVAH